MHLSKTMGGLFILRVDLRHGVILPLEGAKSYIIYFTGKIRRWSET